MTVQKNKKYKLAKELIESGSVTSFREVVDFVNLSNIVRDTELKYSAFYDKVNRIPENFRLKDYKILAKLFDVSPMKLMELTINDDNRKTSARNKA